LAPSLFIKQSFQIELIIKGNLFMLEFEVNSNDFLWIHMLKVTLKASFKTNQKWIFWFDLKKWTILQS